MSRGFRGRPHITLAASGNGALLTRLAVGDGAMDLPLLAAAGLRLAINSEGKLRDHVDFETSDFREAQRWLADQEAGKVVGISPVG